MNTRLQSEVVLFLVDSEDRISREQDSRSLTRAWLLINRYRVKLKLIGHSSSSLIAINSIVYYFESESLIEFEWWFSPNDLMQPGAIVTLLIAIEEDDENDVRCWKI